MKRFIAIITLIFVLVSALPAMAADNESSGFIKSCYEYFEYPAQVGKSVSELDNWSVDNESLDENTTGSTVKLVKSPDDANDTVLNVKVLRAYSANQYAVYTPNADISSDYAVYTADYKIPDVKNDFVTYIKGNITNSSGKTTEVNLSQLVFRAAGVFEFIGSTVEFENSSVPRGRWFNLAVVYFNKNQTFDLYVDSVKVNKAPIKIYGYADGNSITSITRIQIGAPRYSGVASDMYADDIKILSFDGTKACGYDLDDVVVPQNIDNGYQLLTTGKKFGSTISWQSSNENVLKISDGVVALGDVTADSEVTLTATAANNGKTVTRTYTTLVVGDKGRLSKITSGLNSNIISGQKYVKNNFTVNIPGLLDTDTVTVTSSDSSVISISGSNATVIRPDADKYVDLTVSVKSAQGNEATKVITLYVLSKGIEFYYDGMDYEGFAGKQITGAGNWTASNENTDTSVTGSVQQIKQLPDDTTDQYLDIEVFRKYSVGNQLATLNQNFDVPGKFIVQMNLKFPGTENNRYIMYTTGTFENENETKFYESTSQIYFYPNTGTIYCETYRDANNKQVAVNPQPFPANEWFNLKLVYDTVNRYYDVYINNVKQNTSPIYYARNVEGEKVVNMGNIRFGVHRDSGNPGHLYFDDLLVRTEEQEILNHELNSVRIPTTFVYDTPLPTTPQLFEDVNLSWESSDENIITSEGVVNRKIGFGSVPVELTVTAEKDGVSKSKTYGVELINTPPYTIDNMLFETTDGSDTYTPETGGKVKNISVTKYADYTNAKAIVAVYGGSGLLAVSEPIAANNSGTYTVDMSIPEGTGIYAKAFVWNMDNLKPLSYPFRTANNLDEKISVFSMGDSTMQSYGDLAERQLDGKMTGWMQVIPMGVDSDYITIRNYGRSGKSTKSFTEEGYIYKVYEGMSVGDYLIIQFGHNDQKSNDSTTPYNYAPLESAVQNGTVPSGYENAKTYEQWLREYVEAARMKGAYPVFATSIRRRQFDENGKVKNSHEGYPEAMIELSKELNVPVIDLHAKTETWMNNLGEDGSFEYYCVSYTGTDNTHVTYAGAVEVANLAIDEIKSIGLPVAQYMQKFAK